MSFFKQFPTEAVAFVSRCISRTHSPSHLACFFSFRLVQQILFQRDDRCDASDMSDHDAGGAAVPVQKRTVPAGGTPTRVEVKLNALAALGALARAHTKAGIANWSLFLPDRDGLRPTTANGTLATIVLYDR